ncbi:MAG: hypothetical protein WCO57_07840 [Verrucomicrobiota bacterium]
MKLNLILLSIIALPLLLVSCGPPVEYHSVRVYEQEYVAPTHTHHSNDPRDFVPKEKF